ncbi:MAG: hypothetical protein DRJ37_00685 [Thermoprotei archaeon]|nr:MAG: hypothetical protein DRJ37_00685 [Thermoprotei archaeon]
MRLDALATVLIFVIALTSMLFLYINSRFIFLRYSIEAWKCAEIQAARFALGEKPSDIGLIKVRKLYWNLTGNTINLEKEDKVIGCAFTYRLLENGTLLYVSVCPSRRC